MRNLSDQGLKVLQLLVGILPRVVPGSPGTYITYSKAHAELGLSGTAQDLEFQGLGELADYVNEHGLPAISGLVVRQDTHYPGKGYFKLYNRNVDDFSWWREQIELCKTFNWSRYGASNPEKIFALTASDLEVPDRIETKILRIVRDTAIAREVKQLHDYTCQICGEGVELPDGTRYAEAHHIKPLGSPHNGPDVHGNIICVCPNHHVELDYFARRLDLENILNVPGHTINPKYISYHNEKFEEW